MLHIIVGLDVKYLKFAVKSFTETLFEASSSLAEHYKYVITMSYKINNYKIIYE